MSRKTYEIEKGAIESILNALRTTNQHLATSKTSTPVKFSYSLSRNLTVFGKALDQMLEERRELVKQFCELDGKGDIKLATVVANQEQIDSTPEGEEAPAPVKRDAVVFKNGKESEEAADEAILLLLSEKVAIPVFKFNSLEDWVDATEQELDHGATQMMFSLVDLINELASDEVEA